MAGRDADDRPDGYAGRHGDDDRALRDRAGPGGCAADPLSARFAPEQELAVRLLPLAFEPAAAQPDGAHDHAHLLRVWANVQAIRAGEAEPGDGRILLAAVLLHDGVAVPKDSPERRLASRLAARRAGPLLEALGWTASERERVQHAIEAHSFSGGIEPRSVEARILRDADRLDALGAVGLARCFYTAGRMGSGLYHPADPQARSRKLDDRAYALDHFPAKLLGLEAGLLTRTGRALGAARRAVLERFLQEFGAELGPAWHGG